MIPVTLAMSGDQHTHLQSFLFPGDGFEAVAVLLCGRRNGDRRHRLTVREVHDIPYDQCERTPMKITWHTDAIADILERATAEKLSVVKIHSHPGGYAKFSGIDDEGDARLLPLVKGYVEAEVPHGSVVMLPNGEMFGRVLGDDGTMVSAPFPAPFCIEYFGARSVHQVKWTLRYGSRRPGAARDLCRAQWALSLRSRMEGSTCFGRA